MPPGLASHPHRLRAWLQRTPTQPPERLTLGSELSTGGAPRVKPRVSIRHRSTIHHRTPSVVSPGTLVGLRRCAHAVL
jgi:hypothetical protein